MAVCRCASGGGKASHGSTPAAYVVQQGVKGGTVCRSHALKLLVQTETVWLRLARRQLLRAVHVLPHLLRPQLQTYSPSLTHNAAKVSCLNDKSVLGAALAALAWMAGMQSTGGGVGPSGFVLSRQRLGFRVLGFGFRSPGIISSITGGSESNFGFRNGGLGGVDPTFHRWDGWVHECCSPSICSWISGMRASESGMPSSAPCPATSATGRPASSALNLYRESATRWVMARLSRSGLHASACSG